MTEQLLTYGLAFAFAATVILFGVVVELVVRYVARVREDRRYAARRRRFRAV